MAIELASAYISLLPSMKGFSKSVAAQMSDMPAVAEAGRRSGLGWVAGAAKVLGGAAVAGIGATAGVALTKGFSRAIQLQEAEAKLTGLGHSAENVAKISSNALGAVKGTAFGMGEAMTVAANAVAAGVKPGADLERNLKLVGDAATIAGTDMGSMGAIFNKVAASNKVQMDVINQLHDAGVPALSLLADQMGVTAEEASRMASAGEIDFATFQAAMEKGLGGAAQASGQTFMGAMKNMGAALGRLGAMFATPVVTGMPVVFQAITGAIDSLGTVLQPVADRFSAWLVPALQSTADGIGRIGPAIGAVFSLLKTGDFTGAIGEALGVGEDSPLIGAVLWLRDTALSVFSEVSGGIRAMFAAFSEGGTDVTSSGFAGILETVGLVARALWDSLGPVIQQLGPQVMTLVQSFSPLGLLFKVLEPVIPQVGAALATVAGALGGALAVALPVVVDLMSVLVDVLSGTLLSIMPAVTSIITVLAGAFSSLVPALTPIIPQIGAAVTVLADAFGGVLATVLPVIVDLVTMLVDALSGTLLAILPTVADVITILAGAIASVLPALTPLIPLIGDALITAVQTLLPPLLEVAKAVLPLLATVLTTVLTALSPIIPAILSVVQAFLPLLPVVGDLIMALLPPLVGLLTSLAPVIGVVANVLAAILVPVIKVAGEIIQWLVTYVITPLVQWLADKIPLAIEGMKVVWDKIWNGIQATIAWVWNWIDQWVLTPFKLGLEVLKVVFNNVKDGISIAWSAVQTALKAGWDWIDQWIFSPLKTGVSLIGDAFSNVKDAIGTAWDGLKAIAAKPVNFVLGTVYNDGIRKWWNTVAGAVGLDSLKLPEAPLVQFASGGVLPGYTPGRDVHEFYSPTAGRLSLSGGEAIMRPEFTRAVGGAAGVARLNAWARSGAAFASGGVFGRAPETGGFPPEWMKSAWNGVTSFGKKLWDAGAFAAEIALDPVGAVKKAIAELARTAGTGGNSGGLFDMVSELPGKFADGLAQKVKALLGEQQTDGSKVAGSPAGALGVARMSQLVRDLVPFARVTSGFRPGAITATGYPSMHGMGRAIDIAGASSGDAAGMMAIFNALRAKYPNATELIYSPAGGRQIYKGRPYLYPEPTRGDHFDHVHWAMANGGVLPKLYDQGGWIPDGGVGVNLSGRPEAVLTPEESAGLKNGNFGGPLVNQIIVRDEHEAIDELERMRRRELTRRRVTGVLR